MDAASPNPRAGLPPARAVVRNGRHCAPAQGVSAALRQRAQDAWASARPAAENGVRYFFAFFPLIAPVLMGIAILWIAIVANGP